MKDPYCVITIEVAYAARELRGWQETLTEALELLRGVGAARIIASDVVDGDPFNDPVWRDKALSTIKVVGEVDIDY